MASGLSPIRDVLFMSRRLSTRSKLLVWRARLSVPAMIAAADEERVVSVVAAMHGGLAIVTISLCAWLTNLPLLFPSLGPSAFILFTKPFSDAAAPRTVVIGHCTAIASGLIVRCLIEALTGVSVALESGSAVTYVSASLALVLTCFLLVRLAVPHAPACATALIIAVGGVRTLHGLASMVAAVVLLTLVAVVANRIAGVYVPAWKHGQERV